MRRFSGRMSQDLSECTFARYEVLKQANPTPARRGHADRAELVLLLVFAISCSGCNSKPSTASAPASSSQRAEVSGATGFKLETSASESRDSKNPNGGPENVGQVNNSDQRSSPDGRVAKSEPAVKSTPSVAPDKSKTTTTNIARPPARPDPEQLAKWSGVEYQPLQLLACYDGFSDSYIHSLAMSPDGKQFVLGGARLTLWKMTDAQPAADLLADFKGSDVERPIRSVAISTDGNLLAAGDQKGMLRVWSLSDHREVFAIRAHDGRMTQLAFSPDSQTLATMSYSGEVRLWRSSDGKKIKSLTVSEREVARMVFLSDLLLATAGTETAIWNIETESKEKVLTKGSVLGPALGLSPDRRWLAYSDSESRTQVWDMQKSSHTGVTMTGVAAHWIDFSSDGKWIAIHSADSTIRIFDTASGKITQVIDADGGKTAALKWLPDSEALLIVSEQGRVRIWGTPETAKSLSLQPIQGPVPAAAISETRKPFTSAQLRKVMDIRSFSRLPNSVSQWGDFSFSAYNAPASQVEAELFYRYALGNAGWTETTGTSPSQPELSFHKDGCELRVSVAPVTTPGSDRAGDVQIGLHFVGNYDARWLPRISAIESKNSWNSFHSVSWRTRAELTDVEVGLLKQLHVAGWTACTRLAASSREDPKSRSISMLQRGSVLTISIGHPADSLDELFVQASISVSNKTLPVPSDAGWIEFDSSTDMQLVANTKLDLKQTVVFFDKEMLAEGWLAREAGRTIQDDKGWLPYLRGQQDVLVRLVTLSDSGTRIIVGDAERSSWQLQKPKPKKEKEGIEAADFPMLKTAAAVKFEVDQQQILFEMADVTPPKLADQFTKQLESFDWKREDSGVVSDEYVLATFSKAKAEIQLRARAEGKKTTVMVNGDGLLWSKPLPTSPVRISYGAWLRRDQKQATLDRLDEFAEEMHKIPGAVGKGK